MRKAGEPCRFNRQRAVLVAFEAVGLATGFPYGSYSYSDVLGPTLLGVPFFLWLVLTEHDGQAHWHGTPPVGMPHGGDPWDALRAILAEYRRLSDVARHAGNAAAAARTAASTSSRDAKSTSRAFWPVAGS